MLNRQLVFDDVARHLLTQNAKAQGIEERSPLWTLEGGPGQPEMVPVCMYRAPDGKKCGIGSLITDAYTPRLEGKRVSAPSVYKSIDPKYGVVDEDSEDIDFLQNLQSVHDVSEPVDWRKDLTSFARSYGLGTTVLS